MLARLARALTARVLNRASRWPRGLALQEKVNITRDAIAMPCALYLLPARRASPREHVRNAMRIMVNREVKLNAQTKHSDTTLVL
jgi:hypothetical protein